MGNRINIVFVGSDGQPTGETHIIELPDPAIAAAAMAAERVRHRKFKKLCRENPAAAVNQFCEAVRAGDRQSIYEIMGLLRKVGLSRVGFAAVAKIGAMLPLQSRAAFHSVYVERGHIIREEISDDRVLINALRNVLPDFVGQHIRLYRGESWQNRRKRSYGASWTSRKSVAEMFGRGWNSAYVGGGVLLETIAPVSAIITGPNDHSTHLGEYEYLLDRRKLETVRVLERYPYNP